MSMYKNKRKSGEKMKKHIIIITSIFVISTLINVSAINASRNTEKVPVTVIESTEIKYILKDYKGQIALFKLDSETPLKIFEIFTLSLPEEDIGIIKSGIIVSESELKSILEEYTS